LSCINGRGIHPGGETVLYNVNPRDLNREIARELKERKLVTPPAWTPFVKTGQHRQRVPQSQDWWYHRAASIMRTVEKKGPIGTAKMAVTYGGRKNRGVAPDQFAEASTNVIRKCLQQLEKSKLLKQVEFDGHKGRVLTKDGALLLKGAMSRCDPAEKEHAFHEKRVKERAAPAAAPGAAAPQRPPRPAKESKEGQQ
jgi:small subunit ribosomal protein S19e